MAPEIPLLSLSDPPAAFLAALGSTGFLHLELGDDANMPISATMVQRTFELSSQLYDTISLAERARFSRDDDANFNGHSAVGSTYLNREGGQQKPDWKEGFGYARFPPGESWTQRLPDVLEARRAELEAFSNACYDLMLKVLDKLSLAFELPEDYFRSCHQHKGANSVTLFNYPPPPAGTTLVQEDIRAGAHKDWGSVTLLFQQEGGQPGLEIFIRDNQPKQNGMQLMSDVEFAEGKPTISIT
jgi:isopenicillin N synthase-like dioxygenase